MKKIYVTIFFALLFIISIYIFFIRKDVRHNKLEITRFNEYIEELAIQELKANPIDTTFSLGNLENYGLEELLYEIDDASEDTFNKKVESSKQVLKKLKTFDYSALLKKQKLTYDVIKFQNQIIVEGENYLYNFNGLQPMSGYQIEIPLAFMQIELESEKEVEAYLQRLRKIPTLFEQIIILEEEKAKRGYMMPEYLYDETLEQIGKIVEKPESFMIYLGFSERIDMLTLDEQKANQFKEECLKIVKDNIFPAYEKLSNEIKYIKKLSTVQGGICEWGNGKEYYEFIIKSKTSYNMGVEELREWAQDELANGQKTALAVAMKNPELLSTQDLNSLFPKIETKEDIYKIEDKILGDLFYDYGTVIASENIIPKYLEDYLPAGFYFPISIDKEDYGNMYLSETMYNEPGLEGLLIYLHENIPGHHMYFSVLYDKDIPMIRKVYKWLPYEEGWATYMQELIYEYVGLDEKTKEYFKGNSQFSNAISILLDIGIHYDGWSREEAINKMLEIGVDRESIEDSIDRIITNPGEIIHYMYGGYKMQQYLNKCKEKLGNNFDIKEFHDLILENGGVPFVIMDKILDEYINNNS